MKADEICGTKNPTPHQVLLDTRFELPFDIPEEEAQYWTRKLEHINAIREHDESPLQDEAQTMPSIPSQCSLNDHNSAVDDRDSDYRSEPNTHPPRYHTTAQPNSSLHQYPMGCRLHRQAASSGSATDSVHNYGLDYREGMGPSPASSSQFGSSGNLSQATSQFSSEPEERSEPASRSRTPTGPGPRLPSGEADRGEGEELARVEKETKEGTLSAKPSANEGEKLESSTEVGLLPLTPSRLCWLKAVNKVQTQLHQVGEKHHPLHPLSSPPPRLSWPPPSLLLTAPPVLFCYLWFSCTLDPS
ncbi:protein unc-13 homolog B-like [Electrophorus electricus]|uniref:protein unc-13 homolog B-like n=1 Tax=Electrophorus electricus TaxID=8005 RepID=UPI0015CFD166|nr:protein unc-13 homolog B-like [Electrophorus electricus]